jgi:putative ABC transport system substrate-binding protein
VARQLGFEPRLLEVAGHSPDYAAALTAMNDAPGEPVTVPASPTFLRDRAKLTELLIERRTPSICAFREVMEAGALMSYGVNLVDVFRDVANVVDQVAKGAKAGETPMRQLSHFHTAFNLKTAKALGLELSPMLLARADEIIE